MANDMTKLVKFQGMIPPDTKRFLEVAWREGRSPTILTYNDLVAFCAEMGHRELVNMNKTPRGLYVVEMMDKKRMKDAEDAMKKLEYELDGWVPREERTFDVKREGNVTPIRRVDEGGS